MRGEQVVVLEEDPIASVTWESNEVVSCTLTHLGPGFANAPVDVPENGSASITFGTLGEQYVQLDCLNAANTSYVGSVGLVVF